MSIQHCEYCDRNIDTDFNAEHFDCADTYECVQQECDEDCKLGPDCLCEDCREYTANFNSKI